MIQVFLSKLKEAVISVLPIVLIVSLISLILGFDINFILNFIFASVFVMLGLAIFTLGADMSMIEIGSKIGGYLAKKNSIILTMICALILGIIITIAEPDLSVLSSQVGESINSLTLIMVIALGVGVYMVISTIRTKIRMPLNIILLISYLIVFVLAFFVSENFAPLALDSGSVTTGPISVPFIVAFGIGLATVSSVKGKSNDDSFGTVGLVSVGPIIAVMLLGLFVNTDSINYEFAIEEVSNVGTFFTILIEKIPEVALIILPILVFFMIFQFSALRLPIKTILRIFLGIIYVFLGITLFLSAVQFGFLPTGQKLGLELASLNHNWLIVPFFALIGFVIVLAEPAVHVLTKQIENVTSGVIGKRKMLLTLCVGECVALSIVALRVLTGINILYIIIPLFILCFVLTFIAPKMFTGMAFDSGGVVTGAMATTFVLPMIIGIVHEIWGDANALIDAFGSLAIVAVAPIFSVLIIGCVFKSKNKQVSYRVKTKKPIIVEFE